MPKLVWRVKLVAELRSGVMTETEVARIERDEQAGWYRQVNGYGRDDARNQAGRMDGHARAATPVTSAPV